MLEFFVWGGVLQRLPPTLGVYEKHVFGEPLPVPSLRLGGFTPWMIHQGMVKALTRGGSDASLLAQQLDGQLESADSLWTAAQVRLATIPSADEALFGLGNFSFVASHLFYVGGGQHAVAVMELICLIEILEELHTEVQGIIISLYLTTTLLFDVSRRWSPYLNRCVTASSSEDVGAPGTIVPFFLEPILLKIEGGSYVGPIVLATLVELVRGIHVCGGGGRISRGG